MAHGRFVKCECVGYAATDDDGFGGIGKQHRLHQVAHMRAKLLPHSQRLLVASQSQLGKVSTCVAMQLTEESATAVKLVVGIQIGQRTYLASPRVHTVIQLAIDDDTCANAGTYRQAHHILCALALAIAPGTQGKAVGIVVNGYGHTKLAFENLLQMYLLPRGDIGHVIYDALLAIYHRRHTHTNARYLGAHQLGNLSLQLGKHHLLGLLCGAGLYHGINHRGAIGQSNTHVGTA